MGAQTPTLLAYSSEPPFHVSLPNVPGRGTVWNVHNNLPVTTSYPRTAAGTICLVPAAELIAAPTTMTLPTTVVVGEFSPMRAFSGTARGSPS